MEFRCLGGSGNLFDVTATGISDTGGGDEETDAKRASLSQTIQNMSVEGLARAEC